MTKEPYIWETEAFAWEMNRNTLMDEAKGEQSADGASRPDNEHDPEQGTNEQVWTEETLPARDIVPENMIYGPKPDVINEEMPAAPESVYHDREFGEELDPGAREAEGIDAPRDWGFMSTLWRLPFVRGGVALLVVLIIILLGVNLFREPTNDVVVQPSRVPTLDDTPGGQVQQESQQYRETLVAFNDEEADRAESQDRSFVATTESLPTGRNPVVGDEPLSPGASLLARVNPTGTGDVVEDPMDPRENMISSQGRESVIPALGEEAEVPDFETGDALPVYAPSFFYEADDQPGGVIETAIPETNSKLETLRELTEIPVPSMRSGRFGAPEQERDTLPVAGLARAGQHFPVSNPVAGITPMPNLAGGLDVTPLITEGEGLETGNQVSGPSGVSPRDPSAPILLPAGRILHAEMINGLNSDIPGPAVAEIVEGPLAGARLIGQFTPDLANGGLSLQFQTLTMPDGSTQPVTAYGLSPWTGENLTRSVLKPRLLERYGPGMLMAFLSGAAALMVADGQRIVVVNDAVYQERTDGVTERQILAAGVSSLATQTASDIQANQPAGPQILLYPGSPVAILFATSVADTTQTRSLQ